MCGRFVANIPADELQKIFNLIETPQLELRFNVAPTQLAAVVRNQGERNRLDTFPLWLSHNMHDPDQLQQLYHPFAAEQLQTFKVPDLVNNSRFDSPACIAQV